MDTDQTQTNATILDGASWSLWMNCAEEFVSMLHNFMPLYRVLSADHITSFQFNCVMVLIHQSIIPQS